MAMHTDVMDAEVRFCGGWAPSNESKHYMNQSPAVLQPWGLCLAGHTDCCKCVYWPHLGSMIHHNHNTDNKYLFYFIKMWLPSNLSYFDEGGKLWPLWQAMAASLIMYHYDVASVYGPTNAVVAWVLEIAQLFNVQCPGMYDPIEVLKI